ncbi:PQQ-binding-like beta-propeller repeat protein [Blastococcus sp. SYSU D00820]
MRPRRPPLRVWVWTAATVALAVLAALLWRGSDAAATESTTAAPADVPDGTPAGAVSERWTVDAAEVPRRFVQAGRVVLAVEHGVRALDAVSGEEAWHYTRSNARLCDLTAVDDRVVAVFATEDRCDEAVALDAGTGVRQWTRNTSLRPDITLTSTSGTVLATAPTGVTTFDPIGDTLRWRAAAGEGCRIEDSAVGSAGVVLLESCADAPAPRLRLLQRLSGEESWTRDVAGGAVTLAGVDDLVTVVAGDQVQVFDGATGAPVQTLDLPPGEDDGVAALTAATGDTTFVWASGTLWALAHDGGAVRWSVPALGVPAVTTSVDLLAGKAQVWVPEEGAFVQRDPLTGAELARAATGPLPDGIRTAVLGPLVLTALPDRVSAAR